MKIKLKEAYGDDAILKQFPKPDYSHISTDIQISDATWILFKDIHIDDAIGNPARLHGQNTGHIEELKYSFANGVNTAQPIGAVQKRPLQSDGTSYPKPYELVYSFGRTLSQIGLGAKGWAFNIISADETVMEDIQSFENEDTLPKAKNKEEDIVQIKVKQIEDGRLSDEEDDILANLKKTYPGRKKASINNIAAKIYKTVGVVTKYAYYEDSKITLWRENHASKWFEVAGKLDRNKKLFDNEMHGFTSKIGGLYRTWYRALNIKSETGKNSYVNCFTDTVTKGSDLHQQREHIKQEYINLRVNYAVLYGKDINFLTLNGLFPQEQKVDDWKNFILFDQKEIERLVKKGIRDHKVNPDLNKPKFIKTIDKLKVGKSLIETKKISFKKFSKVKNNLIKKYDLGSIAAGSKFLERCMQDARKV